MSQKKPIKFDCGCGLGSKGDTAYVYSCELGTDCPNTQLILQVAKEKNIDGNIIDLSNTERMDREAQCPFCEAPSNAYTGGQEKPTVGDFSICISCARVAVFDEGHAIRKPTIHESLLICQDPSIKYMREKVLSSNRDAN